MLTFGNYLSDKSITTEEHTPQKSQQPKSIEQSPAKFEKDNDGEFQKNDKEDNDDDEVEDSIESKESPDQKSEIKKEGNDEQDNKSNNHGGIIGSLELKGQQDNNFTNPFKPDGNNLLIMSPKNLKKRIEIVDFEKVEKESTKKERRRYQNTEPQPDVVSEWMSPSHSQHAGKNLNKAKSTSKIQKNNLLDIGPQLAQLLDLLLRLTVTYVFASEEYKQAVTNYQDQITIQCVGIGLTLIFIISLVVVKKRIFRLAKNFMEVLKLSFQATAFICFTEYRVVPLQKEIQSSKDEEYMGDFLLEIILIGGIYYVSILQFIGTEKVSKTASQSLTFSRKLRKIIRVLISMLLIGYLLVRFCQATRTLFHVGIFLGISSLGYLFFQKYQLLPIRCLSRQKNFAGIQNSSNNKSTYNGNIMNINSPNSNNLVQMFSPRFGGFQVTSTKHDKNAEIGGYFFNNKTAVANTAAAAAAAAATFAFSNTSFSSTEAKNLPKLKNILSDKNSSKNSSNKVTAASGSEDRNIMSPKVFESVQYESPRDMLDSHRAIFFDTRDQNDGEVGELEKAATAAAAANFAEKTWSLKQKEDQEEEDEQVSYKNKDNQREDQNYNDEDEEDEENLDMDISDNHNVSLFKGERSDTVRDNTTNTTTNTSAINMKNQETSEQPSNINHDELQWRLAMQDLILHSVNEGIIVIRKDSSEVIYANRQACHLLGAPIQFILPTLLQLRNVLSYKDEVLNFSEILQQFDKPPELSDLLNLRGMFSNLHNRREIMICVGNVSKSNSATQEQNLSDNTANHDETDTSFPSYNTSNITGNAQNILNKDNSNNSDNHEASFSNYQSRNDLMKNTNNQNHEPQNGPNSSNYQPGQSGRENMHSSSFSDNNSQKYQNEHDFKSGNTAHTNQNAHNNSSSIKTFFDTRSFIAVEMEVVLGNFGEKYVLTTLRRMGWTNPLCAIHSSTLKVQYFIRKMISELSVDMNDMRDYFMNTRMQPTAAKVDVAGCLGKLECMAEFLQDFATSSLIFSGTFIPIRAPLNLPSLIGGVLNKISSRTANEAYKFTLEYDRTCPEVIFSDFKRLERVFYNLLLYFVDTNEQASVVVKVSSLSLLTNPDNKRLRITLKCQNKEDHIMKRIAKPKNEPIPLSLLQKKANITNVYMLENMHYGVLLSSSIIQKLEPNGLGIFFRTGSQVSFSFKISIGQTNQ